MKTSFRSPAPVLLGLVLWLAACGETATEPGAGSASADTSAGDPAVVESTGSSTGAAAQTGSGNPGAGAEIDPCGLLTDAQVSEVLGKAVQGEIRIPGAQCSWYEQGADRAALFVTVKDFRGLESFASQRFGEGDQPVAGIGTKANLEKPPLGSGIVLNVLVDGFVLAIGSSTSEDPAPLKALAPTVIAALP